MRAIGVESYYQDYHGLLGTNGPIDDWRQSGYVYGSGGWTTENYVIDLCQPYQFPFQIDAASTYSNILSESQFRGQSIFLKSVEVFYALLPGLGIVTTSGYPQLSPHRVKFVLIRSDVPCPVNSSQPQPPQLFNMKPDVNASVPNELLSTHFPRNRVTAAQSGAVIVNTPFVAKSNMQVLKSWSHIMRPYDNFAVQNQAAFTSPSPVTPIFLQSTELTAGAIGGEKIIQRRKFFKINQRLTLQHTHGLQSHGADLLATFIPQYMLMYYIDTVDQNQPTYATSVLASSSNPRIAISVRFNYMDA